MAPLARSTLAQNFCTSTAQAVRVFCCASGAADCGVALGAAVWGALCANTAPQGQSEREDAGFDIHVEGLQFRVGISQSQPHA